MPGCGGRGEHGRFGFCRACWQALPGNRKIGLAQRWAAYRSEESRDRRANPRSESRVNFDTARAAAVAAAGTRLAKAG